MDKTLKQYLIKLQQNRDFHRDKAIDYMKFEAGDLTFIVNHSCEDMKIIIENLDEGNIYNFTYYINVCDNHNEFEMIYLLHNSDDVFLERKYGEVTEGDLKIYEKIIYLTFKRFGLI